jgi:hypothetical protein
VIQLKLQQLQPPLLRRQTPPLRRPRVLLLLRTLLRPPLYQPLHRLLKPHQNKSGRFTKPTHV